MECSPRCARVGDEPALVALPPILEAKLDVAPDDRAHLADELEQAHRIRRPAPEVEGPTGNVADILERAHIGIHRVADVENVADLPPVAVDRDRPPLERADE